MTIIKRLCFLFLTLIIASTVNAQDKYEVTAKTFLNVRSYESSQAPVLGTIERGGIINVYSINGEWAKISFNGDTGYVNTFYIRPLPVPAAGNETSGSSVDGWFHASNYDCTFLIYVILALSIVLFILRKRRGDDALEDTSHKTNWIIFMTTCILELIYVSGMGSDSIWFCIPDKVGWLWTILNFILFAFVIYNQWMCFFNTLEDVRYNSYAVFDWQWGIYAWGIGIVAAIICSIFFQFLLVFVGIAFIIAQLIQIGIIFKKVLPRRGCKHALICTGTYLIGSVATVIIVAHFMALLIIVLIGLFILSLLGKTSTKRRCSNCRHLSGNTCSLSGRYISSPSTTYCDNYE